MKKHPDKEILNLIELGELCNNKPDENRRKYLIWKPDKLTELEFNSVKKNGYMINGTQEDTYNIAYILSSGFKEVKLPPKYIECFFSDILQDCNNIEINKTNLNMKPIICPRLLSKYKKPDPKKIQTKKPYPSNPKCILSTTELVLLKKVPHTLSSNSRMNAKFPNIYLSETVESKPRKKRNKLESDD